MSLSNLGYSGNASRTGEAPAVTNVLYYIRKIERWRSRIFLVPFVPCCLSASFSCFYCQWLGDASRGQEGARKLE
jgi:hypothetical protein